MDRSVPMLLIGLVFGGGIGFLVAAVNGITLDGHDHGAAGQHGHAESTAMSVLPGDICASQPQTHGHDTPFDLATGDPVPVIALTVTPDPISGWNVHAEVENFTFAPENAGCDHVLGEGHAHVYVNGTKVARQYGPWLHFAGLPEGAVRVEVGLYTNDHRPIHLAGAPVTASVVVNGP